MDYYLMYGSWELTPGGVASKNGTQEEQSVDSKCREGLAPSHNWRRILPAHNIENHVLCRFRMQSTLRPCHLRL